MAENEGFTIPYGLDVGDVANGLKLVDDMLDQHEEKLKKVAGTDPFKEKAKTIHGFNTELLDGTRLYVKIEQNARSYREEIARLQKQQEQMILRQSQALNSMDYDRLSRQIQNTRTRIAELTNGLNIMQGTGERSIGIWGKLMNFLGPVGRLAATVFSVDQIVGAEQKIVSITGKYERYEAVLTNSLKSEVLAADSMKRLSDFAVDTPNSIDELTESFVKFVNRGIIPTNDELKKQGDLAASQGKSFDQLTEAMLDGLTGEYERLKEFGIRAKTEGDNVTLTFRGVEKQIKKTDEEGIRQAILSFGALSGVANSMGVQMKTVEGLLSNIGDSTEQIFKNLGDRQSGVIHGAAEALGSFVGRIRQLTEVSPEAKLRQEQAEFNALADSILLANEQGDTRSRLMSELIAKYPSILALIDSETASDYDLARAITYVNEQYRIKIELAAQEVLAKRNAERTADAYERQADALKSAGAAYRAYLNSIGFDKKQADAQLGKFSSLSGEQQEIELRKAEEFLNRKIAAATAREQTVQTGPNAGTMNPESLQLRQQKAALTDLQNARDAYNQSVTEGVEIGKRQTAIQQEGVAIGDRQVEQAKQELAVLKEKAKTTKLTADELEKVRGLEYFIKHESEYGKPPATPKPKVTDTEAAKELEKRKQLIKQLEAEEVRYADQMAKIALDSNNVRLQLGDKFSEEYLTRKKAFDQLALDAERRQQVIMYAESQKTIVKFKDAAGKTQQELRSLLDLETAKFRSQGQDAVTARNSAISSIDKNQFSTDSRTAPARELLGLRQQMLDKNALEDQRIQTEKIKSERIGLLSDGFEKEKQVIEQKYRELIALYKGNEKLIAELRSRQALDIETAKQTSAQKGLDTDHSNLSTLIQLRPREAGESELQQQKRQQEELLKNDKEYYQKSIAQLEQYLLSRAYMQGIADGQVSAEQVKANNDQLALLKAQFAKVSTDYTNFTKINKTFGQSFTSIWEVASAGFTKYLGKESKVSQFFQNKEFEESFKLMYSSVKGAVLEFTQAEIEKSKERIQALESEISEKTALLADENDRRKQGLANNYETVKKSLEDTKKARDDEKENLRRNQKEKAAIEALEIGSSTAVAFANLLVSMSQVTKGFTTIPFAGVPLAIAGMATLFAGFTAIRAKLSAATKLRKGTSNLGSVLEGASHENGGLAIVDPRTGEVKATAEGDEVLMGTSVSRENRELLTHINERTFKYLDTEKQRRLLKPLGIRLDKAGKDIGKTILQANAVAQQRSNGWDGTTESLKQIARNTGKIQDYQLVALPDGSIELWRDGKPYNLVEKK